MWLHKLFLIQAYVLQFPQKAQQIEIVVPSETCHAGTSSLGCAALVLPSPSTLKTQFFQLSLNLSTSSSRARDKGFLCISEKVIISFDNSNASHYY